MAEPGAAGGVDLDRDLAPRAGRLSGRGDGAKWLLQYVKVGDVPTWTASDKLLPIFDAPSESV